MKFPISISKEFGHITIKLLFIKLRIKYKCKLAAVMCVKNEEYHLPTFLKHIENYVDFIVAVDDGSTDSTYEILNNHPLCKEVVKLPVHSSEDWNEADNRILVMNLAKKHGADWVLCCDPDERFQTNFLKKLRKIIADDKKQSCYHVKFRELWGRYDVYRADGVWNKKEKGLLFPLPKEMNFNYKQNQHIHWHPSEIRNHVNLKYNLYHMKMIKREEREKRKDLYNAIDPNCEMQKIGYNYLTDEEGIKLVSIPPKKEYDYSLIPEDLKTYAE
jgi:glycosyltransferase involved in cell wall biosynthesis